MQKQKNETEYILSLKRFKPKSIQDVERDGRELRRRHDGRRRLVARECVEELWRRPPVDDDRPRRRGHEPLLDGVVEEREELVVEPAGVEDADGLGVHAELLPGDLVFF